MSLPLADLPVLSRLLDEALALEPDRRDAWLDALPPEHEHLHPALCTMLDLQRSELHVAFLADGPKLADDLADASAARPGDRVGPYRLIREIGRGGMGAVWLADRADGTLKRQVALKLPRLTFGADMAKRMARERDIGALLEHPNIARLYDAGIDADGQPYLALEYIDGEPLDAWCRSKALGVPGRLRLFLRIVRAVAYAHGRLVVHRDIKPSNVLVTADGQAHLLDFGIARLLEESPPDDGHRAQDPDQALTPHYASPEQLRGEAITVASDVYSLGVLLFELLTERLPHELADRSLTALKEAVLEREPPLASTRAQAHRTAVQLRGEIDAIIAKALKRVPGERYATADAMAEDIERHLGGERVLAHPDHLAYRVSKTLRRHRASFAAATAVLLALLGGSAIALVEAKRANDTAHHAKVIKDFVVGVFQVYAHGKPARAELRELPVELLVERGTKLIETQFAAQPRLQSELYGVVAGMFAGIGAHELTIEAASRQLEAQTVTGASGTERAQSMLRLAQALLAQGRSDDAQTLVQAALALAGSDSALQPRILLLQAHLLLQSGARDEGMRVLEEAEQAMTGKADLIVDAAHARSLRANLLVRAGRYDEALALIGSAVDDAISAEGPLSPTAIDIRLVMAYNLTRQGRGDEARPLREAALEALRASGTAGEVRAALEEAEFLATLAPKQQVHFEAAREAIERDRALIAARGPLVPARVRATIDFALGRAYLAWGDLRRADPLISSGAGVLRTEAGTVRDRDIYADAQASAAMLAGRHDEAESYFLEALEMQRLMGADRHPDRAFDHARRAFNRSMQGRFDEAEAILAAVPPLATRGADPATIAGDREFAARTLARIKLDRGDAAAALALLPAADTEGAVPYPFDPPLLRGEVLCALGRRSEGLALLERSLRLHRDIDYGHSPQLARAQGVTGLCALAAGQRARAAELAELARVSLREQTEVSPYFRRPSERLDALLKAPPTRA
jgi:eukaryotic-like serine/threonine-protein kinase